VARSIPAHPTPGVLRWARETIDLTDVAAARRIGVADDRVAAWEAGEALPTVANLRKAADVYKRPLAVFFLPEPPEDFDTLRDFRRLAGSEAGRWSPALHTDFRRVHEQRGAALELADLDETEPSTEWRLEPLPRTDTAIAAEARAHLLDHGPLRLPGGDQPYGHLNTWVAALETAGVLVAATAGGRVPLEEMRAFSLYFDVLPVIVVNGKDSPRGRLFSLMHEYAHLLLHTEGLCDTVTDRRALTPDRQLEARCNALAAEMLAPAADVLAHPLVQRHHADGTAWDYADLRRAAAPFGLSAEALLRRLLTLGRVTRTFYREMREEFQEAYRRDEERERSSGGNANRNAARDLGKGFVRLVADAYGRRVIDSYTASTYLNVRAERIPKIAAEASFTSAV
jgi:Zn-dependent peptidase ImmA (M78 family)/transcriptional regulator with XRE-family HTH domain